MSLVSKAPINLQYVQRATGILAQTGTRPLFAITGRVVLTHLLGEITTVIQAQADATKLINTPNVGSAVDLCATNDITGDVVNGFYTITGTAANAMVNSTTSPAFKIASPVTLQPGTLDMNCAASNTGSVKWTLMYYPLDNGAAVYAI